MATAVGDHENQELHTILLHMFHANERWELRLIPYIPSSSPTPVFCSTFVEHQPAQPAQHYVEENTDFWGHLHHRPQVQNHRAEKLTPPSQSRLHVDGRGQQCDQFTPGRLSQLSCRRAGLFVAGWAVNSCENAPYIL